MTTLDLTELQNAVLAQTEARLEDAYADGIEYNTVEQIPPLTQYDNQILTTELKKQIKDPFKAVIMAFLQAVEDVTTPGLSNSWSNSGLSAGYYRNPFGEVQLRGSITGGTIADSSSGVVFTLPVGHRPTSDQIFVVYSPDSVDIEEVATIGPPVTTNTVTVNTYAGAVKVTSDGDVRVIAGNNSLVTLDNIRFRIA